MFWKYIEKINWEKQIQHIPFLKNKQLYINIEYKGYTWECGLECEASTFFASRGWWLCFTIAGVLFRFLFHDKRWYNENEGRFYLEDEPRWVEYSDPDYLQRVRAFMKTHPDLKEGYYERVVQDMEENIKSDEALHSPAERKQRKRDKLHEKYVQAQSKILLARLPKPLEVNKIYKATLPQRDKFPWWLRWKWWLEHKIIFTKEHICLNFGPVMTYAAKWNGEQLNAQAFCVDTAPYGWMAPIYFLPQFNLYDQKGNLLSKATDYEVRPPWDIYDTNGNLLYKDKYSSLDIGKEKSSEKHRRKEVKFESINRSNIKRFAALITACGGTQGMIDKGIPWERVAWARTFWHGGKELYFALSPEKDKDGIIHLFVRNDETCIERTKQDLAYSCDLYDKDGKLLSIMFWAF